MGYYRITLRLKNGQKSRGIKTYDGPEKQAYWDFWKLAADAVGEARIDGLKVEPLPDDHPEVLEFLKKNR